MFKLFVFLSMMAVAMAAPKPGVLAAAGPFVTATSSQVIARNYNAAVVAAPVVAAAPVAAPLVAAPAPVAAPLVAAPGIAPYSALPYSALPYSGLPYGAAYPYSAYSAYGGYGALPYYV